MLRDFFQGLRSEDKIQVQKGLEGLAARLPSLERDAFEEAVQAVVGLFYVDSMDHPELVPVMEQAESVLADLGERAVPVLLSLLGETDLKAHFHLAAVLGKMGHPAVEPLLGAYARATDAYVRVFALYALGKVKDPRLFQALPVLFGALEDANPEVRDTAARSIGKLCESTDPERVGPEARREIFDRLLARVSDRYAGVRSKAVRSLGKMARFGLLDADQKRRMRGVLERILGEDDAQNWDVAYIVRAEAETARGYL